MKKIIFIISLVLIVFIGYSIFFNNKRTDVYLKEFYLSSDKKTMTIKVGVTSSSGYIRKMKRTSGSMDYYYTFYSTFFINSKIGSKDRFEIILDDNVESIYFYTGDKGYKKVLEKLDNGEWKKVKE